MFAFVWKSSLLQFNETHIRGRTLPAGTVVMVGHIHSCSLCRCDSWSPGLWSSRTAQRDYMHLMSHSLDCTHKKMHISFTEKVNTEEAMEETEQFTCQVTPDQICSSSTPHPTPLHLGCALWWPHLHATGHWQGLYDSQIPVYSPEKEKVLCVWNRTPVMMMNIVCTLSLATQCTVADGFLSWSRSFSRLLPYAK